MFTFPTAVALLLESSPAPERAVVLLPGDPPAPAREVALRPESAALPGRAVTLRPESPSPRAREVALLPESPPRPAGEVALLPESSPQSTRDVALLPESPPRPAPVVALRPESPPTAPEVGSPSDRGAFTIEEGRERLVELERLGDRIAELAAHLHAATYRLLVLLREFDERGGWHGGFKTCGHWLSWRTGIAPGAAREKVRVARALGELPLLSDAMRKGELSYSKVRALTRVATRENEHKLLDVARCATAAHVEKIVGAWREVDRLEEERRERERHARRELHVYADGRGSYVIEGRLDPEVGAVLLHAVRAAEDVLYPDSKSKRGLPGPARRADALGLLAEAALGMGLDSVVEAAAGEASTGGAPVEEAAAAAVTAEGVCAGAASVDETSAEVATRCGEEMAEGTAIGAAASSADDTTSRSATVGVQTSAEGAAARPAEETSVLPASAAVRNPSSAAEPQRTAAARPRKPPRTTIRRADRYQVVLHVVEETLREGSDSAGESNLEHGPRVSAETSRRLSCDCSLVRMTHDAGGNVLDVGRKTRTIPPALRRALNRRDRGCRFPGCDHRYCAEHHIKHWIDGGETKLANLLLCHRHHRAVHEEGFRVKTTPDGEMRFYTPEGELIPEVPEPPPVPDDPVAALGRHHRNEGLEIGPWTATPHWNGERLDLGYAISALWTPR